MMIEEDPIADTRPTLAVRGGITRDTAVSTPPQAALEAAEAGATRAATAAEPPCTSGTAATAAVRQSSASGACAAQASATRAATAAESPHSSGATTAYCSRGPRTLSSSWRRWRLRVRG